MLNRKPRKGDLLKYEPSKEFESSVKYFRCNNVEKGLVPMTCLEDGSADSIWAYTKNGNAIDYNSCLTIVKKEDLPEELQKSEFLNA